MGLFNIFKKKKPATKKKTTALKKRNVVKSTEPTMPVSRQVKKAPLKIKESATTGLLKEPHISEKATFLSENGKYVFKIYKNANKSEIKKAISNLYGVAVKKVNIINIKTKTRILRGRKGEKPGYKKAIITLEKGHKIEILPH